MNTEDKIKNEIHRKAHKGYFCSGDGNPEFCYICDCIYRAIELAKSETLKKVFKEIRVLDKIKDKGSDWDIGRHEVLEELTKKLKELETKK